MTSKNIQFRVYNNLSDVPLTTQSWDQLVSSVNRVGVFLQYAWITTWWQYFGQSFQLCFITAESGGKVIAFAPLMIDESRTLRFIGDMNSDYMEFVIPPGNKHLLQGFLEFLLQLRGRWSVIHLRNIPRDPDFHANLLDSCKCLNLRPWNNYSVAAPFLPIEGHEAGVAKLLNKYSLRRSERKLQDQGDVRFEVFESDERAMEYWESFSVQHETRCLRDGRTSPFSDENYLPFLKALFDKHRDTINVHFSGVFLNDKPVAFHFGFISRDRLLWYKPSFDTELRTGSPGVVLILNLIRHAQQHGISELDFTIGEESFKDRFCKQHRLVDEWRIHASRTSYFLDVGYWRTRQKLKNFLAQAKR